MDTSETTFKPLNSQTNGKSHTNIRINCLCTYLIQNIVITIVIDVNFKGDLFEMSWYNTSLPSSKRNWSLNQSLLRHTHFFPSFLPILSIPSHHPPLPPPLAFLSHRKSRRLTCKWGLLNPIRPSVTSQQRERRGEGREQERETLQLEEGRKREKLKKGRIGGKNVKKGCFFYGQLQVTVMHMSTLHIDTKIRLSISKKKKRVTAWNH